MTPAHESREALRLYDYAPSCNCDKVRLLLSQLGRDYERVPVDIFNGETLTAAYGAINPLRTTPVLETDHGHLPESNAILVYLAAGTPLHPKDPFELAQVIRWLIYEQTDVMLSTWAHRGAWSQPGACGSRRRIRSHFIC